MQSRATSDLSSIFETLETRQLMSASIESYNGAGNNTANPNWGSAGETLLRLAPSAYADGISSPAGANRPSPRVISNTVDAHGDDEIKSDRNLSAFAYAWGQFIDHDLDLTIDGTESFNIAVPKGDPYFDPNNTGTQTISLNRSEYDPTTGVTTPRQQTNDITSFIDGSMIYGSDATRAAALRTFSGGQLKTSAGDMLPYDTAGLSDQSNGADPSTYYLAGDVRANENIELTSLQTLFVREHNRLAGMIAKKNPHWSDERIYQEARKLVIGEIQAITYNEFLPALLGNGAIARYTGYKSNVNPDVSNEFSTAAFRL